MRRVLAFCLVVISLAACLDEKRVEPAKPSTFVRYINGGYADEPRALEKTPDGGYVILANTFDFPNYSDISSDSLTKYPTVDRVKLVKVDQYGTVLWTRTLPNSRGPGASDFRAHGIEVFDDGYIITGEVIKSNGKSNLLIIQTDADGLQQDAGGSIPYYEISLPSTGQGSVTGMAAKRINDTSLLVLGSISGTSDNMVLARINLSGDAPQVNWDQSYGGRRVDIINKLYLNGTDMVFAGSITEAGDD